MNGFVGKVGKIPENLKPLIEKNSFNKLAPITLCDLSFLEISYLGFDGLVHRGEMIVHASIADEVLEIFEEIFIGNFPIETMRLIDYFGANDTLSMESNNCYNFCYRANITFPDRLSWHSYGLAIDINPIQNPYIKETMILPESGKPFTDRSQKMKGMIHPDEVCVKAFTKRGWVWGGYFQGRTDYHHFEKPLKG